LGILVYIYVPIGNIGIHICPDWEYWYTYMSRLGILVYIYVPIGNIGIYVPKTQNSADVCIYVPSFCRRCACQREPPFANGEADVWPLGLYTWVTVAPDAAPPRGRRPYVRFICVRLTQTSVARYARPGLDNVKKLWNFNTLPFAILYLVKAFDDQSNRLF
jgi:hypothetical protein